MKKAFLLAFLALAVPALAAPWPNGETLSYHIAWGVIPVADADFSAHQNADGWRFHLDLRSRGPIEAVKPIRDQIDSQIAAAPWRSTRYEENRHEGSHLRHTVEEIDYAARTGLDRKLIEKTSKPFAFTVEQLDDAQSLFYHLRQIEWRPGMAPQRLPVYYGTNIVPIEVTFQGREKIEVVENGPLIPCIVLRLRPIYADAKKNAQGHWATVWLSDDARRIPWRVDFKASFGTFTMTRG